MATWADLKAQAADILGIQLVDANVGNVPLLATDQYGNVIPGANGFPQIVTTTGLVEGDPAANGGLGVLVPANAILTGHAFLADIAHNAVPEGLADGDIEIGLGNGDGSATDNNYDNELLDAHYVAGDGRANENIGLTAVHHVFHSEHNRLVEHTKSVVIADAQAMLDDGASQAEAVAFLNEWLIDDVAEVPAGPAALIWDGERLFQAASSAPRCNISIWCSRNSPARSSPTSTSSSFLMDTTSLSIPRSSPSSRTWFTASATRC
ncbi:peroxidase family protein [Bradyrhizobium sp. TZ2]